jgi:hypothetical protein
MKLKSVVLPPESPQPGPQPGRVEGDVVGIAQQEQENGGQQDRVAHQWFYEDGRQGVCKQQQPADLDQRSVHQEEMNQVNFQPFTRQAPAIGHVFVLVQYLTGLYITSDIVGNTQARNNALLPYDTKTPR